MNRRQKNLLTNLILVLTITVGFGVFITNLRNSINASEATRSLELLGKEILEYRHQNGSLPGESYIDTIRKKLRLVRLGNIHYRAQWIGFGADEHDTILAYKIEPLKKFLKSYYIILWLDGRVVRYSKADFDRIINEQQNKVESEWLKKNLLQKQSQTLIEPDIF